VYHIVWYIIHAAPQQTEMIQACEPVYEYEPNESLWNCHDLTKKSTENFTVGGEIINCAHLFGSYNRISIIHEK